MAKNKAPIKIPKLYPTETIEIEGNKIELRGYKVADKPYEILMRGIQREEGKPLMKRIGELQKEVEAITIDEDGNQISDEELEKRGLTEKLFELLDEVGNLQEQVDEISDKLVLGNLDEEEMNGPAYLLAQRGLKRFYHPGKTSTELDEIEDIEIGPGYIMTIANIMIKLTQPPSGVERSIEARKRQEGKDADKGKQSKGKKPSQSKKK